MKFETMEDICFKGNWLKKGETFDADLKDFDFLNDKKIKLIEPSEKKEVTEEPVKAIKKTTKKVK